MNAYNQEDINKRNKMPIINLVNARTVRDFCLKLIPEKR